ncbi:MAG: hypothetical protein OXC37_03165, partial [Bdellovibrionaceae bacterium]|nr:hypothetical protein [Pseudobdellovibrionaceae bacterium]
FYYWAHNVGQSLVNGSLIKRIERLKKNISISCNQSTAKQNRCLAREQIKKGEGLSSSLALKMFANDLLRTYPAGTTKRKQEVANYVKNILSSSEKVFNYEEDSQNTNIMLKYYKNQAGLSEEEAIQFQKEIDDICPKISFE